MTILRNTLVSCSLAGALALGCGPQIRQFDLDPTVTYESMQDGGVGVGGFTSAPHLRDEVSPQRWAGALFGLLVRKYPESMITSEGELRMALGTKRCERLLEQYAETGEMEWSILAPSDVAVGPRYIIFARIGDNVESNHKESTNHRGTDDETRVTESKIERTITVVVDVFDRKDQRRVIHTRISDSKSDTVTQESKVERVEGEDDDAERAWEAAWNALDGPVETPGLPKSRDLILVEFVERLPEPSAS